MFLTKLIFCHPDFTLAMSFAFLLPLCFLAPYAASAATTLADASVIPPFHNRHRTHHPLGVYLALMVLLLATGASTTRTAAVKAQNSSQVSPIVVNNHAHQPLGAPLALIVLLLLAVGKHDAHLPLGTPLALIVLPFAIGSASTTRTSRLAPLSPS